MNFKKTLCSLALCILPFMSLQAAEAESLLRNFLQGLNTLQADFQQTLEQPEEEGVYFSSGTFYLKRPGQLRWEYDPPNNQLIVADGDRIWLYDRELDQVSFRSQKAALEGTPAQLLSATGPLDEHFKISQLSGENGIDWVELTPKDKDSQFNTVHLAFSGKQLLRMEMVDNFGQTTRFVFTNMQRNPKLDKALFEFTPPPLIDVIGDI